MKVLHVGKFRAAHLDRQWQQGLGPSHHLHAVSELRGFGHELRFFDADCARSLGRLRFQAQLLGELRRCNAVIAHNLHDINAVAALRALGLVKVPILAFVHSVWLRSAQKLCGHGADLLLPLSREAARRLRACGIPARKIQPFDYGADLAFYPPGEGIGRGVLSVGVIGRDFGTLIEAARHLDAEVTIVGRVPQELRRHAGDKVRILSDGRYDLPFERLRQLYEEARVVAVPHHGSDHPYGLNGVVEAMAMARPVVLTESRGIDIDPAALGFGACVPAREPQRLASALAGFLADPAHAQRCGLAGREHAVRHFNARRMAGDLARALEALA